MTLPGALDTARRGVSPSRFLKIKGDLSSAYFYVVLVALHLLLGVTVFTDNHVRPITCTPRSTPSTEDITALCYSQGTFTIEEYSSEYDTFPGIGKVHQSYHTKSHQYYKFAPYVIAALGPLFYLPHLLWRRVEKNRATLITEGMLLETTTSSRHERFLRAMQGFLFSNAINQLAPVYFVSAVWNMVNIFIGTVCLHYLFNSAFLNLVPEVTNFAVHGGDVNPLDKVFPYVTMCKIPERDTTGSVYAVYGQCILATNKVLDKAVCIIWIFYVLALIPGLIPTAIFTLRMLSSNFRSAKLQNYCPAGQKREVYYINKKISKSAWLFLTLIGPNVSQECFSDLINELYTSFRQGRDNASTRTNSSMRSSRSSNVSSYSRYPTYREAMEMENIQYQEQGSLN